MSEWKPGEALPCIVCKKHLENVHVDNQPYSGLAFSTRGHYGSSILDPLPGDGDNVWLVVNICDDCVKASAKDGQVLSYEKPPTGKAEPKLWDGK